MENSNHHTIAPRTYFVVFGILLVLLVATVAAAAIRDPLINNIVAISIATAKAVLIVLYFMHVRHATSLVRLVAISGFVWLVLLISLTLSDFVTRGWDRTQPADVPREPVYGDEDLSAATGQRGRRPQPMSLLPRGGRRWPKAG